MFDMTLGFVSGGSVTVTLTAPDWFGNMHPVQPPNPGIDSQDQLGLFFGTSNEDTGSPDVDLNLVESIVTVQSLITAGMADITGQQLTTITFGNATSILADTGIYGLTVRDPQPSNGACCCGSACIVTTAAACSGNNRTFAGAGVSCTPFSNLVPCCRANYNKSAPGAGAPGGVSVQDIFDFLTGYFSSDPCANTNDSAPGPNAPNGVSVQDIFDFLAAYFAGCP
jgi:hypothetical protein